MPPGHDRLAAGHIWATVLVATSILLQLRVVIIQYGYCLRPYQQKSNIGTVSFGRFPIHDRDVRVLCGVSD